MNRDFRRILQVASATILFSAVSRAETTGSITPIVDFVTVKGDERKFREDLWMQDGWTGGIDQFTLEQDLGNDATLRAEGRGVLGAEDYRLQLELVRYNVGFIRVGGSRYRSYSDDWGGFYRPFTTPALRLGRDLHLTHDDISVDIGLTLPDWPELTLGYERQSRDGTKSLLEWGSVQQGGTTRKIFPSYKTIDEKVDIFKADLDHHVGLVNVGDQFRYEQYSMDDTTFDKAIASLSSSVNQDVTIQEHSQYDLLANVFHMDSRVNTNFYWSAAYMYNRMNGDASLLLNTTPFSPVSPTLDAVRDWYTQLVGLDQDSHVVTANLMFDPCKEVSVYGGAQAEKTHGTGNTDAVLLEILETFAIAPEALIRSDTDKKSLEETFGARFIGIPHTTVYAEGKWQEEQYSLDEVETDDAVTTISHDSETDVFRQQYTFGFNTSPFRRVTLSTHYRRIMQTNQYESNADISPGYPGFMTEQDFTGDEVVARLTVRPHAKLMVALQYQYRATDIRTANRAIRFSGTTLVPAGERLAGDYQADTYTISVTVTPVSRLYLTGASTFQDTRTIAFANHVPSMPAYRGNVYSAFGGAGYALDNDTDLTMDYAYSRSENLKDNSAAALPLGLDNQRHGLTAGLSRRIHKNIVARIRYGFYESSGKGTGGVNSYHAQLASASCTIGF